METALVLVAELEPIAAKITEFHIDDQTIYEATEFRAELKAFKKRVEDAEEAIARPLKTAWEQAREPYLALRKKVDETERLLNKRLSDYAAAENAKRIKREQEERQRQLEALKAAQIEAEKKQDVDTVIALAEAQVHVETKPQEDKLRSVEIGKVKVSFRDNWLYRVIELDDVPAEYTYKALDSQKVNDAIKRGVREIKGLEIYNQPIPVQGRA